MARKFWAHGTEITFGSVKIGGCTSIGLPERSKEEVEITSHDSQGWREFVAGLRDGGTVALTCRLRPSDEGQRALAANFAADGEEEETVITLPPDPENSDFQLTFTFQSFVLDDGGEAPFDDAGEVTYTLRISGPVQRNDLSSS